MRPDPASRADRRRGRNEGGFARCEVRTESVVMISDVTERSNHGLRANVDPLAAVDHRVTIHVATLTDANLRSVVRGQKGHASVERGTTFQDYTTGAGRPFDGFQPHRPVNIHSEEAIEPRSAAGGDRLPEFAEAMCGHGSAPRSAQGLRPAGLALPHNSEGGEKTMEEELPREGESAEPENIAGDDSLVVDSLTRQSDVVAFQGIRPVTMAAARGRVEIQSMGFRDPGRAMDVFHEAVA